MPLSYHQVIKILNDHGAQSCEAVSIDVFKCESCPFFSPKLDEDSKSNCQMDKLQNTQYANISLLEYARRKIIEENLDII